MAPRILASSRPAAEGPAARGRGRTAECPRRPIRPPKPSQAPGRGLADPCWPEAWAALAALAADALTRPFAARAIPDLHVSQELAGRTFAIAGAAANAKVSWQVTGLRRDAWAEAHRIEVEVDKTGSDRGRYLHPVEHAQAPEKGIGHAIREQVAASLPTMSGAPARQD